MSWSRPCSSWVRAPFSTELMTAWGRSATTSHELHPSPRATVITTCHRVLPARRTASPTALPRASPVNSRAAHPTARSTCAPVAERSSTHRRAPRQDTDELGRSRPGARRARRIAGGQRDSALAAVLVGPGPASTATAQRLGISQVDEQRAALPETVSPVCGARRGMAQIRPDGLLDRTRVAPTGEDLPIARRCRVGVPARIRHRGRTRCTAVRAGASGEDRTWTAGPGTGRRCAHDLPSSARPVGGLDLDAGAVQRHGGRGSSSPATEPPLSSSSSCRQAPVESAHGDDRVERAAPTVSSRDEPRSRCPRRRDSGRAASRPRCCDDRSIRAPDASRPSTVTCRSTAPAWAGTDE